MRQSSFALLAAAAIPSFVLACAVPADVQRGNPDAGGDSASRADAEVDGAGGAPGKDAASDAPEPCVQPSSGGPTGTADYPLEVEPNDDRGHATRVPAGVKGVTGWLACSNDLDFFRFDVAAADSLIKLAITDGQGGCPAGAGTVLRVYDANGNQIGVDSDSGPGNCSLVDPATMTWARGVAAGTYYASVEDFGHNQALSEYVLSVDVSVPRCGDGVVNGTEQCDSGGADAGTACKADCTYDTIFTWETEPNDTIATANALPDGSPGFAGDLSTSSDDDHFSFTVTVAGSAVRIETTNLAGTACPSGADTLVNLYDPSGTYLGYDDDAGDALCSLIDPKVDSFATNLAVGTYTVDVQYVGSSGSSILGYGVRIEVKPPGCGNGIVEGAEECDDSNLIDGDGCSRNCTWESLGPGDLCPGAALALTGSGASPRAGFVSGNTSGLGAQYEGSCASSSGAKDAVYVVTPDVAGTLSLSLVAGFDAALYVRSTCGAAASEVGCGDRSGNGGDSVSLPVVAGVPLWVVVDGTTSVDAGAFTLTATLAPSICGNGVVDPGEQCDQAGGGCSATCVFDPPFTPEVEPNGDRATATTLVEGAPGVSGAISPIGDHDWFTFKAPGGKGVRIEVFTGGVPSAPTCPTADTVLTLVDDSGVELGSDDDDGQGYCSLIDPTLDSFAVNLPAGAYHFWVRDLGDTDAIASYFVSVTFP